MEKQETVLMVFDADKFYMDPEVPIYLKGVVSEVPKDKVTRWLKRGGVIISPEDAKALNASQSRQELLSKTMEKDLAKEVKADGQEGLAAQLKADAESVPVPPAEEDGIEAKNELADESQDGEELEEEEDSEDSIEESNPSKSAKKKSKKARRKA